MKFLRILFWMNLAIVGMIGGVHVSYTFDNFHELLTCPQFMYQSL